MKLSELLKDVNIKEIQADLSADISDIRYDSREVGAGDLFVAIRGCSRDGHEHIADAAERGAAVIVCERVPAIEIPYILTEDSREALAIVSRNYFGDPAASMTLVGITGTNGKTTTTMLLKHVLEVCADAKIGLIGTNNNIIRSAVIPTERTTPESYELHKLFAEMKAAGCTHVIMEVSSHAIEQKRVAGLRFAVGAFTNLTQDHLDYHGDMDSYATVKAKLFSMCGKAAVNADDKYSELMLSDESCEYMTYSLERTDTDVFARDIRLTGHGVRFAAMCGDELQIVQLNIPGRFSVYNALTVISCAVLLGLDFESVCGAMKTAPGVKGRMEVVPVDGDYTVIIDYAHTPDALENVLRAAGGFGKGRIVVLFGCGGDRDKGKRPLMGEIAAKLADYIIVTSDNPRTENPGDIIRDITAGIPPSKISVKVIEDRVKAIHWAIDRRQNGDVIILAGKGHEDYQIIGTEKHHMDEREIISDYLKGKA